MTDETRDRIARERYERLCEADPVSLTPRELVDKWEGQIFEEPEHQSSVLPASALYELSAALEAALDRERLGAEAMRKLANEASGFLAMAEKDNFGGVTNRRCLAHRIMLARERLKAREPVETRPDHTDLSREKGGSV